MAGLNFNPQMIAEPRALKGGTFTPPTFVWDVGGAWGGPEKPTIQYALYVILLLLYVILTEMFRYAVSCIFSNLCVFFLFGHVSRAT